nr:hypothetical protein [uncultured Desulfobacter sp.]
MGVSDSLLGFVVFLVFMVVSALVALMREIIHGKKHLKGDRGAMPVQFSESPSYIGDDQLNNVIDRETILGVDFTDNSSDY